MLGVKEGKFTVRSLTEPVAVALVTTLPVESVMVILGKTWLIPLVCTWNVSPTGACDEDGPRNWK